jgi:hypothetical protein
VRFNLQPLTDESYIELAAILDTIFEDINEPEEKRPKGNPFGHLMADFYNYLDGARQSQEGVGTPLDLVDDDGYTTAAASSQSYDVFDSPLVTDNICSSTYLIFIGNTEASGPNDDSSRNSAYLKSLYEAAGVGELDALAGDDGEDPKPLRMPEFTTTVDRDTLLPLGPSQACYQDSARDKENCTDDENEADGLCAEAANCFCDEVDEANSGNCNGNRVRYSVVSASTTIDPSGDYDEEGGLAYNLDDWAKYLHDVGILYSDTVDGELVEEYIPVITYTIDVFNAQPNAEFSGLLFSAAQAGGGRYFQARSEDAIYDAINTAFGDINAKASSFAAVTLPLSATNRAQVDNEIYIGMFRPSLGKKPRWFGDLKRYQLALFNEIPLLADVNLNPAVNTASGFVADCAASFWTNDSGDYWDGLGVSPSPFSTCSEEAVTTSPYSDLPDGPFVEKGGVAQMIREGPAGSERKIFTVGSGSSEALRLLSYDDDASSFGTGDAIYNYFIGDGMGADETAPASGLRPSVHGDVVHSRPLSIRFDADTVAIFFGANDGLFRAVDTETGQELWAMVAPEHFDRIERLYENQPLIDYEGAVIDPNDVNDYEEKDYFFDGITGAITIYGDSESDAPGALEAAYIYPTMRRGGRMVYALGFDMLDPNDPVLMWRHGCPNLNDDVGCTGSDSDNFDEMGQTWSSPVGAKIQTADLDVNAEDFLVVMFGGGFDDCLNEDVKEYTCTDAAKGKMVYILDAVDGNVIQSFETDAPVVMDLSTIDVNFDGYVDFAYFADVAGSVYRINFVDLEIITGTDGDQPLTTPLETWTMYKVAEIDDSVGDGAYRRVFNTLSLGGFRGTVFGAFGTGDRERPLDTNYPYEQNIQNRFYAFIDRPYLAFEVDPDNVDPGEVTTLNLDGDTMLDLAAFDPNDPDNQGENPIVGLDGWYLDLPDQGEQVANPAAIGGGKVFFNTFQPEGGQQGFCQSIGTGKAYSVDLFDPSPETGTVLTGGGIPIPPIIATVANIPPGCKEGWCTDPPDDPCAVPGVCKKKTLCLGCEEGFNPIEIDPFVDPFRTPVYFTEDIDRHEYPD